jgi:cytochrome c oxidase cbb3-type subunit 3
MTVATRNHEFDGIREFDNRLPRWWLWTLYLACIFAVVYWIHYHTLGTGDLPGEEFRQEQQAADLRLAALVVTPEKLLELSKDPVALARGKAVWDMQCVACHKPDGGGLVGPNLTDNAWVHGGAPDAIHTTITKGVPEKGMLSWGPLLGAGKVRDVTAFVLTLKNTNAPGGKPPEGKVEN